MAVRQVALVSDESALEACLRRCAIQIDDLLPLFFNRPHYSLYTFLTQKQKRCAKIKISVNIPSARSKQRANFQLERLKVKGHRTLLISQQLR